MRSTSSDQSDASSHRADSSGYEDSVRLDGSVRPDRSSSRGGSDGDERHEELGPEDPRVARFFGEALPKVAGFAGMLVEEGVRRGLIGPREVPRLWERHLINSGAIARLLPTRGTLIDVGSGAGLPGVVLAAMRPDLDVVLLEPMERRVTWLEEVVASLGLSSVRVVRGRAEELHGMIVADAVTARAVAPLDRLVSWTLPLLKTGGVLLAMKGGRAAEELTQASEVIAAAGGSPGEVLDAPADGLPGTTVVRIVRTSNGDAPKARRAARRPGSGAPSRKPSRPSRGRRG